MKNLLLTFKLLFEKQISVIIFTICKYFNKNFTKVKRFIICPFYVRRKPSMIYFLFFEKHPVKEASWTLCTILWREQKEFSKRINLASVHCSVIYCLFKATWMTQRRQRNRHAMLRACWAEGGGGRDFNVCWVVTFPPLYCQKLKMLKD